MVEIYVMKWIGQNFGHPHHAGLHVFDEAQVNRTEQQTSHTQEEP